jgi:hypothetical protein
MRRPVPGGLPNEYQQAAQKPRSTLVAEFWNPTGTYQEDEGKCSGPRGR